MPAYFELLPRKLGSPITTTIDPDTQNLLDKVAEKLDAAFKILEPVDGPPTRPWFTPSHLICNCPTMLLIQPGQTYIHSCPAHGQVSMTGSAVYC